MSSNAPPIVAELLKVSSLAWTRVQDDAWNRLSVFIYQAQTLRQVEDMAQRVAMQNKLRIEFIDYAIARWYTHKTHDLVVDLFCRHANVKRWPNPRERAVDFELDNIPFDLKLTHVSAGQARRFSVEALKTQPDEYIMWLYREQSKQERFGVNNRLFVVCYNQARPDDSWKLKRDWHRLAGVVDAYLLRPTYHPVVLGRNARVLSDVILVSK